MATRTTEDGEIVDCRELVITCQWPRCDCLKKQRDEQRLNKNDPDWMFDELMAWPVK